MPESAIGSEMSQYSTILLNYHTLDYFENRMSADSISVAAVVHTKSNPFRLSQSHPHSLTNPKAMLLIDICLDMQTENSSKHRSWFFVSDTFLIDKDLLVPHLIILVPAFESC